MFKRILWLLLLFPWLTGCTGKIENAVLSPVPHEVTSPKGLAENLTRLPIYWRGVLVYLDGKVIENDPITQLKNDKSIMLGSYKFSHNGRYLVYRYADVIWNDSEAFPGFPGLREKMGIWDLETGERKVLVEIGKDFPKETTMEGLAFFPGDSKVLFSVMWRDNDKTHADLATVDMESGMIKRLGMYPLPVFSLDLDISPDGKWAVLAETATLDNQVCLLVNLEQRTLDCLPLGKGHYISTRLTPNENIVFVHRLRTSVGVYASEIGGTENKLLVSGLSSARIFWTDKGEVIFSGATYDNYKCSSIYIVNLDGSDFRRLSYLGEECLTDDELKKMSP
ncbi:hypothetical protein D6779_06110 [Candidatus Parcubacteria bacterium]|nr:MAG: hypothetical protein D6779_06110 [Candidatus Parcubacteria bacterium]